MSLSRKVPAIISLFVLLAASNLRAGNEISLTHIVDLTHTLSGKFPIVPVPGLTFPFDNLGKIPPKGATIFAGALKVEGASASPIRLIAVW